MHEAPVPVQSTSLIVVIVNQSDTHCMPFSVDASALGLLGLIRDTSLKITVGRARVSDSSTSETWRYVNFPPCLEFALLRARSRSRTPDPVSPGTSHIAFPQVALQLRPTLAPRW